jgi:hypothetical protein
VTAPNQFDNRSQTELGNGKNKIKKAIAPFFRSQSQMNNLIKNNKIKNAMTEIGK